MRLNEHSHVASMLKNLTSDSALLAERQRIEAVRLPGQANGTCSTSLARLIVTVLRLSRLTATTIGARHTVRTAVGPAAVCEQSPDTRVFVRPLRSSVEDQAAVWRGIAGTTI